MMQLSISSIKHTKYSMCQLIEGKDKNLEKTKV